MTVAMTAGGLPRDAWHSKFTVLSVVHSTAKTCKLTTLTAIKNCCAKCSFQLDRVCSDDVDTSDT